MRWTGPVPPLAPDPRVAAVAAELVERLRLDVDEAGILLQEPLQLRIDPRPRGLVARRGRGRQLIVYSGVNK